LGLARLTGSLALGARLLGAHYQRQPSQKQRVSALKAIDTQKQVDG